MKKSLAVILITAVALCFSQVCHGQAKKTGKEPEANRLAREGAEAAKSQDWDKAVELLRKAASMDHKYSDELAAVYQGRGYADAHDQKYQDAINEYSEAAKLTPQDVRIYEQRAAVEMKINDYDKALADYSEVIKLKPNEAKYYNYRAYIHEVKNDSTNAMADSEKALKLDPNNQDAKARKLRLEQKAAANVSVTPPPSTPKPAPTSPHGKKKP